MDPLPGVNPAQWLDLWDNAVEIDQALDEEREREARLLRAPLGPRRLRADPRRERGHVVRRRARLVPGRGERARRVQAAGAVAPRCVHVATLASWSTRSSSSPLGGNSLGGRDVSLRSLQRALEHELCFY